MITWNTEIVNRLKTGSIPRVFLFGDGVDRSKAPYVTVKPMASADRKVIQIFVHFTLGNQDALETYIYRELPALLAAPLEGIFYDRDQRPMSVRIKCNDTKMTAGPYTDIEDNTLAMSRDFWLPVTL